MIFASPSPYPKLSLLAHDLSIHIEQSESRDNIPVTQYIQDVKPKPFEIDGKIQTSTSKQFPAKLVHYPTGKRCEPVDSFISSQVEGQETVISAVDKEGLAVPNALRQELETRQSPPMNLIWFEGKPMQCPSYFH